MLEAFSRTGPGLFDALASGAGRQRLGDRLGMATLAAVEIWRRSWCLCEACTLPNITDRSAIPKSEPSASRLVVLDHGHQERISSNSFQWHSQGYSGEACATRPDLHAAEMLDQKSVLSVSGPSQPSCVCLAGRTRHAVPSPLPQMPRGCKMRRESLPVENAFYVLLHCLQQGLAVKRYTRRSPTFTKGMTAQVILSMHHRECRVEAISQHRSLLVLQLQGQWNRAVQPVWCALVDSPDIVLS